MKIVILQHARARRNRLHDYDVGYMADHWKSDGHEVIPLYGTDKIVPADVCFVHVDLSFVPDSYLEFARQYPVAINGKIQDIRKRSFSHIRLQKDEDYAGPVIVKSNENCAGWPEFIVRNGLAVQCLARAAEQIGLTRSRFYSPLNYRIYQSLDQVSDRYLEDPYFHVEKFMPEIENGLYHVNMLFFMGGHAHCFRFISRDPVVKGRSIISREPIAPHGDALAIRNSLDIDHGKLDYCVHQGRVVLLDINKIVGRGGISRGYTPDYTDRVDGFYRLVESRMRD